MDHTMKRYGYIEPSEGSTFPPNQRQAASSSWDGTRSSLYQEPWDSSRATAHPWEVDTRSFGGLGSTMSYQWSTDDYLGRGQTGRVYRCRLKVGEGDQTTIAAAKVFTIERYDSSNNKQSVQEECEILSSIKHSNIVKLLVLEYEETTHVPVLIMEFMNGGTLDEQIHKTGIASGLCESDMVSLIEDITAGLTYLHGEDILHRDLKPENILYSLAKEGSRRIYKIADFGLAARVSFCTMEYVPGPAHACGTLSYIHPQMYGLITSSNRGCTQSVITTSIDMWSFGVTLYVAATGQFPFHVHEDRAANRDQAMFNVMIKLPHHRIAGYMNMNGEVMYSSEIPEEHHLSRGLVTHVESIVCTLFRARQFPDINMTVISEHVQTMLSIPPLYVFDMCQFRYITTFVYQQGPDRIEQIKAFTSASMLSDRMSFIDSKTMSEELDSIASSKHNTKGNPKFVFYKSKPFSMPCTAIPKFKRDSTPREDFAIAAELGETACQINQQLSEIMISQKVAVKGIGRFEAHLLIELDRSTTIADVQASMELLNKHLHNQQAQMRLFIRSTSGHQERRAQLLSTSPRQFSSSSAEADAMFSTTSPTDEDLEDVFSTRHGDDIGCRRTPQDPDNQDLGVRVGHSSWSIAEDLSSLRVAEDTPPAVDHHTNRSRLRATSCAYPDTNIGLPRLESCSRLNVRVSSDCDTLDDWKKNLAKAISNVANYKKLLEGETTKIKKHVRVLQEKATKSKSMHKRFPGIILPEGSTADEEMWETVCELTQAAKQLSDTVQNERDMAHTTYQRARFDRLTSHLSGETEYDKSKRMLRKTVKELRNIQKSYIKKYDSLAMEAVIAFDIDTDYNRMKDDMKRIHNELKGYKDMVESVRCALIGAVGNTGV